MAADPKSTKHDPLIGRKLGGYTITRCVGKGGMGVVYEAQHQRMSQRAAVKVLNQAFSADAKVLQRFFNEAKALSLVQHPGIVKIFEFGQLDDATAFIMMEFLDGEPLAQHIAAAQHEAAGLPLALTVELGAQIAAALASIHAKGVVHRDLKPDNVFLIADALVPRGLRVKLLDFGIAKFLEGAAHKTTVGMILGTPLYMSPEQCEGSQELDAKVDVYALGVMLYEMIAGHLPFVGGTNAAIMRQHLIKEPPALATQRTDLPVALTELVHRMLAKHPAERPTMPEVFAAMDALLPAGDQKVSGLRQELALHLAVHQHTVGAADAEADPLAPTMGSTPPAQLVTPLGVVRPTPVITARARRRPLLLGVFLVLVVALGVARLAWPPSHHTSRGAAGSPTTVPVAAPLPNPAPAVDFGVVTPAVAPPADLAVNQPEVPPGNPDDRKNRPKVGKPRTKSTKSPAHGKPAGPDDERDMPWR